MKKKYTYVLFLWAIMGIFPLLSFSQQAMKPDAFAELENEFAEATLSPKQLHAFETRAMQKLHDLIDYYQVVNEESYPPELREQALRLINSLFADSTHTISFVVKGNVESTPIYQYFSLSALSNSTHKLPEIGEINIRDSLSKKTSGEYHGKLIFQQKQPVNMTEFPYSVDIVLSRKEKLFGKKLNIVWEVKLGDIIF